MEEREKAAGADGLWGIREAVESLRALWGEVAPAPLGWVKRKLGERPPSAGVRPRLGRTLSVATMAFLTMFGLEVVFRMVDPFGLHHASVRHANEMSARTLAPFYASAAQDRIAVVLIDEATLRARGMAWPPPHAYYAEMLRRILRGNPRAVYVDLLTVDERGTAAEHDAVRENLAAEIAASGVPVFFAQDAPGNPGVFATVPGLRFATAGWQRSEGYPLSIAPAQVIGAPEDMRVACDAATAVPSVALALYDAACRAPVSGGKLPAGCTEPASALQDRCAPLWVLWGLNPPPPLPTGDRIEGCDPVGASGAGLRHEIGQLLAMVARDFRAGFSPESFEETRQRCPFTLTVPEQRLDRDTVSLLRDRVVLVGANLAGMDDSVVSPVHSRLPGVYLHAMALDNLMHFGNAHPRPAGEGLGWTVASLLVAFLAAFLLAVVLGKGWPAWKTWLAMLGVGILVAVGPSWLYWRVWHRAPPNWLEMVAMLLVVTLHARHRMRRDARGGH